MRKILLITIVLIAAVLRFTLIGSNPPSLTWDEAAWGYNAYTLGIDGRDEFGRFLPVDYIESFGDFKPPLYAYLAVLPVKIFGLNEFATRFPSAFFGSLTVLVTYFLVLRLFPESRLRFRYALVSAGILAISPWHIMLSRGAFEANIATFFIVGGMWLFLKGIQEKGWMIVLSSVMFVLSFYTFNTPRVFVPMLVLILGVGFWKQLLQVKKQVIAATIIGVVLLMPLLPFLMTPQASLRFQEVNIFSDITVVEQSNEQIANDENAWWSKIIHNRRLGYMNEFVRHYFDNLTPNFLFTKGDGNPKFSTESVGQLYLWEAPFLIAGVLLLIRRKEGYWWVVPLWLLIGIIPAATAHETPHALRIETTLPTFQILVAYAVVLFLSSVTRARVFVITMLCVVAGIQLLAFQHEYYFHYPKRFSREWQYGYKEAVQFAEQVKSQFGQINMTTSLGRPYAYVLFYAKTDPLVFRTTHDAMREAAGFVTINGFDRYRFADDVVALENKKTQNLFIDEPDNIPGNAHVLQNFYTLDGEEVLTAYIIR